MRCSTVLRRRSPAVMFVTAGLLFAGSVPADGAKKKPARVSGNTLDLRGAAANTQKGSEAAPRNDLDEAIRLARNDDHAAAAVRLAEIAASDSPHSEEARYNLAKSLYRLELYNAAVDHFSRILALGPSGRYFQSALEWCLFISRKMVNGDVVDEAVANHSGGEFPEQYRDEFFFRLARFHYTRALAIESGAVLGTLGETRVEDTVTGGKSFQGDIFGTGAAGGDDSSGDADAAAKTNKEGGLSFEDDIFGTGGGDEATPSKGSTKKAEPKKKGRHGRRHKSRKSRSPKSVPDVKVAPPAASPSSVATAGAASTTGGKSTSVATMSAKDHTSAAERYVLRVNPNSKFGPRAKFLEALILYKLGRDNDGLEAIKTVLRVTEDVETPYDQQLHELALFQRARMHFGAKQPSFSIRYYDQIDRDSYSWLDAIYESSWAEFRLGSYEKALGNLLTLHSPFFADQYYPESMILKAVIYYENCRYPDAKEILKDFLGRYEPVHEELKKLTQNEQSPDKYYEILANLRAESDSDKGQTKTTIVSQVLSLALSDANLERLDAAYREVDAELKRAEGVSTLAQSRLANDLATLLGRRRSQLGIDAGRAVKRKLDQERDEIKTLIEQAIRIDVETSRAQIDRMEAQLQSVETRPKETEREYIDWTDDEKLVWGFEGEYWRDELGTYELTLTQSCGPVSPMDAY
ncbi:MAG: tetratricopeptide repeat protein [Deltaproteobacteria bacterium]|nr:tetratricopeptide repeat protein [Deltaproteobacteria bacterium]